MVRCTAYGSADARADYVRQACDLVGGQESLIMPGDTVLPKPNLVQPYPYETGATTNPHLVEALALPCRGKGARRIIIGDGSCVGADTIQAFKDCGLNAESKWDTPVCLAGDVSGKLLNRLD